MRKVKDEVYWVGATDWKVRHFMEMNHLPITEVYNSYLIKDKNCSYRYRMGTLN